MKKILKQKLLTSPAFINSSKLFKPFFSGIGQILMFHRICPKTGRTRIRFNTYQEVSPEYLENIICFFKDHDYEFISMDQMYWCFQKNKFAKKFVAVTFDDGYLDNLTQAFPILKRHHIPFIIYITNNFPNHRAILWWDLLEDLILQRETIEIKISHQSYNYDCSSPEKKEETFCLIRDIIIGFSEKDFLIKIKEIFNNLTDNIYQKTVEQVLNWDQIISLSQEPLATIGAHTVNHYSLRNLPQKIAEQEIIKSKEEIESQIRKRVEHFAYPYGGPNQISRREVKIAKKYGFKTAVTTIPGNIFPAHKNYLDLLPRLQMRHDLDNLKLQFLINGWTHFKLHKFKRVITI